MRRDRTRGKRDERSEGANEAANSPVLTRDRVRDPRDEPEYKRPEGVSIWDDLRDSPLLEPTYAEVVQRGYFRTLFSTLYDRMGSFILVNLAVSVQIVIGALAGLLVGGLFSATTAVPLVITIIIACVAAAPAFAGLFSYARAACDPDMAPTFRYYLRAQRRYARRSWGLLALQAVTGGILFLNLRFYGSVHSLVGATISVLVLLLALLWAMAGMYAWPLLVRDLSWRLLVRNAFFLALAAPISTLGLLLGLSVVGGLLVLIRIGVFIALFAVWAVAENLALTRLVRTFNQKQEQLNGPPGSAAQ
jgi:uncharacterized membrane protein YesL